MADYSGLHARILESVNRRGTSVTFSLGTATITGKAVQDAGGFRQYLAQGLISAQDEVIFFVPTDNGDSPEEGYTLTGFSDVTFITKRVVPIAPNGTAIAARVVVSK